jgi:hypothetical protein
VKLLGRAPREVYRVYDEHEFFDGDANELFEDESLEGSVALASFDDSPGVSGRGGTEGCSVGGAGSPDPLGLSRTREGRRRRLTGAAMLVGAVGAVGGLAIANGPWTVRSAADRRTGGASSVPVRSHAAAPSPSTHALPRLAPTPSASGGVGAALTARATGYARPPLRSGDGARRSNSQDLWRRATVARAARAADPGLGSSAQAGPPSPKHPEFGFER